MYLTVFIVLEAHVEDEVCAFWCGLELCGGFATEIISE